MFLANGQEVPADLAIWATGAVASKFLRNIQLPSDSKGFLLTGPTLQSIGDKRVFAVGDSGTLRVDTSAKAGVFAVRQGPVLWKNLNRAVHNEPLVVFEPQSGFLKLLNLSDGRAIAEYKGRSMVGRWCWSLKDYIDRKFIRKYQDYEPKAMDVKVDETTEATMRCLGCGGKLGGASLSSAIDRMNLPPNENVIVGLENSDDAAIVRTNENQVTVTADFFAAPFDDPYLIGRIAALNSASDCFAMNARPTAALTMAQVPFGHARAQSDVLFELLFGAQQEFSKMDATIVGGHSIEGPRLTIGFTVLADQIGPPTQKGNLAIADRLILTKPLGTGVLLAAHMRGLCRAEWFSKLVQTMLLSNQVALGLADQFRIRAMTDITGFGLAGHLIEMLDASNLAAAISLKSVPVLDGVNELIRRGIESSLAQPNQSAFDSVEFEKTDDEYAVESKTLFDPQTAGGLLLAVNEADAGTALEVLNEHGFAQASDIGEVVSKSESNKERLIIC